MLKCDVVAETGTFADLCATENGHLKEILSLMAAKKHEPVVKSAVSVAKGSGTNKSCPLEAAKSTSRCSIANFTTWLAGDQKGGELTTKECEQSVLCHGRFGILSTTCLGGLARPCVTVLLCCVLVSRRQRIPSLGGSAIGRKR